MTFGKAVKPHRPFGQRGRTGSASPIADIATLPKPHVVILVNSWGTGAHMVVADRLSQELQQQGCRVSILTDEYSSKLIGKFSGDPDVIATPFGREAEYLRALMSDEKADFKPDVLLTEHFPLCNNSSPLAQNMLACVKTAKDIAKAQGRDIKICGLVRDIPTIQKIDEPCRQTLEEFNTLLVRGDPSFVNYRSLFAPTDFKLLEPKLCYSGYMVDSAHAAADLKRQESNNVVVCLGGGDKADNDPLYEGIIRSIPTIERQHALRHKTWHFYVGSDRQLAALRPIVDEINKHSEMTAQERSTGKKTAIELDVFNQDKYGQAISSDVFASTLRHADFAICRGGLTAIEAAAANVPTLVIPRSHEEQGEQDIRADALERSLQARVTVLSERKAIAPVAIRDAMMAAFDKQRRNQQAPFNTDGMANAATSLIQIHNDRKPISVGAGHAHSA